MSANVRDPRLNGKKRPSSRSPDRGATSAKRHTGPSQLSNSLATNGRSGNGTVPMAAMSPVSAAGSSSMVAVEKFFDATIQAAEFRMQMRSAQAEREKANREFQALQDKFNQFPAIKEQKTAAKMRATQKVNDIQQRINGHMPEQRRVLSSLASLIDQSEANAAARPETQSSKTQLSQSQAFRTSLSSLESRVADLESTIKGIAQFSSLAELKARLKRLEDSPRSAQADPAGLQEKLKGVEIRLRDNSAKTIADIGDRIVKLEKTLENTNVAALGLQRQIEGRNPAEELLSGPRLESIESRVEQLKQASVEERDEIVKFVDEEMAALRSHVDKIMQASKAVLKNEVGVEVAATQNVLRQELHNGLLATKSQFEDGSKIQHQNASAINDCLDRLQKLEAESSPLSGSAITSLQQALLSLQEKLQKLESEKRSDATRSTPARNCSVFQPVLPDNEGDGSDGIQANGTGTASSTLKTLVKLRDEVEMLKGVTTQHSRVINNLTTDEVVRQMVDQMSAMYPDARNFQLAANDLRTRLQSAHEMLASLNEHIRRNVADVSGLAQRIPDLQAKFQEEIGKLQADISGLTKRTEQHETALGDSQTKLQTMDRLAAENKILLEGAQATKEKLKTVASLQDQLLKLRKLSAQSNGEPHESDSDA